jgi:DNA repair protein RadA/Sms
LQVTTALATTGEVLYVSGEESLQQLAMRARRLELPLDKLRVAAETRAEEVAALIERHHPTVVVLDSIQVMELGSVESVPGSITQVRETAAFFTRLAKQTGTIVILVGHVTKEGSLAGPKVLEHMIDCFVMLDSPEGSRFRTSGLKNRFGRSTNSAFCDDRPRHARSQSVGHIPAAPQALAPGSVATVTWEGAAAARQCGLVDDVRGVIRAAWRWDSTQRLAMQLAVLHRHCAYRPPIRMPFANVVGGVGSETGSDLALLAVLSASTTGVATRPDRIRRNRANRRGEGAQTVRSGCARPSNTASAGIVAPAKTGAGGHGRAGGDLAVGSARSVEGRLGAGAKVPGTFAPLPPRSHATQAFTAT